MTDTTAETPDIDLAASARDLAVRAIKSAEARVEALNATAEKTTAQMESSLSTASTTLADAARNVQGAIYEDVKAAISAIEKVATAQSLAQAAQVHVQYLGERGQANLARMAKANAYWVKAAQDAFARMAVKSEKAA